MRDFWEREADEIANVCIMIACCMDELSCLRDKSCFWINCMQFISFYKTRPAVLLGL